ncbi:DUF3772 domain-containing protein [Limimaricola hongkongensis]|uniref:Potassium efflux system KefA protein / Small-conductance mechanosensitive channel n=1 Tax=Limimaricola hongkongensis DSM 17492 TaxID=1122180 RepID=A0A017HDX3_9RHOB|nr:DUF3772 domain-containing protein [Limimaricola hongkongensis]EYD72500.1 Potassium efflux system KefA protein / Small-conductance mechanosensitive channel [Limimaricola hongkongensis DSM 17492]
MSARIPAIARRARHAARLVLSAWLVLGAGGAVAQGIAPATGGLFDAAPQEEPAAPEVIPPDGPAASVEEALSPAAPEDGAGSEQAEADRAAPEASAPALTPVTAYSRAETSLPGTGPLSAVLTESGVNWESWERIAARSEAISERGQGSDFALQRLREELVIWRDRFQQARGANGARIGTVEAQLTALGPAPEAGGENEDIAARRAALSDKLMRLRAPVRLADESYAHADGLIREIDRLIRERRGRALGDRGPSPLNPGLWPGALIVMYERLEALGTEIWAGWLSPSRRADLGAVLAEVLLLGLLGGLLMRAGLWARRLRRRILEADRRGARALGFFVSLGQVALPFGGLVLIARALDLAGLTGPRAGPLLMVLPLAGIAVLLARWMAGQFFGPEAAQADRGHRRGPADCRARRQVMWLGWAIALAQVSQALISTAAAPEGAQAVLSLPLLLFVAVPLFLLGQTLAGVARDTAAATAAPSALPETSRRDTTGFRQGLLSVLGKVAMAVAVVAPVLSVLGYAALSDAILVPAIQTMMLIGVLVLLQRLVFDVWTVATGSEDLARDALVPVLIGLFLILAAVPVGALIWGARPEDLAEVWTRFREGYSFGDTRLQPTDLMWLMVIFVIGYALTRLVQRALRSVVLPRTKLDIGGQNAVAVGFGYVGITAAAILAITTAGLDLSNLAIVAGALSVGIGFGLQNIVSNFVAGIILLIERPIGEGDWIEVGGQSGYVRDISVRSTRIETFDKTDVIVPNADLVSNQVTNWTRGNSVGRVIVPVGVAHGSDLVRVQQIMQEVADLHPLVLANPEAAVLFRGFGPSSLNFEIRAFLRDINFIIAVQSEMNHEIARRFAEEGIKIPFPQQDLWLRNPETLRAARADGEEPDAQG